MQSLVAKSKHSGITLEEFFAVWCTQQNFIIKEFHLQICEFLADTEWNHKSAVLQVFRNAGKSTLLAIYITWRLVQDPTLRVLVRSADNTTAEKIIADVANIIYLHPMAQHLIPDNNTTWNRNELYVKGHKYKRDASVSARGILSNITGGRSDINIFDDVEVPKNCSNELARTQLRARIRETSNLLEPQKDGRTLYVGTPHTVETIYQELVDKGSSALTLPLMENSRGEYPDITAPKGTLWPEKFGKDELYLLQRNNTRGEFISQYLLIPYNVAESRLNPAHIKWYRGDIDYREANKKVILSINDDKLVHVTAFWDVSLSKSDGDQSVLAIVYVSERGNIYVHRLHELKGVDPEEQCVQVKNFVLKEYVPAVYIETNGIGNFLPPLLRNHLKPLGIQVIGSATSSNKSARIIKSLETPLYGSFLNVHESIKGTPFETQMRDFKPHGNSSRFHDDYIDSVSCAIEREPIRVGKSLKMGDLLNRNWGNYNEGGEYEAHRFSL